MNHPVLSALLPVVLLIAIGLIAGKLGWIRAEATKDLSNLVFMVLSPALLFRTMATVHPEQLDFAPVALYFGAAVLLFAATLAVQGLNRRGAVLGLACTFSNTVMIGIPLITLAYGDQGLVILLTLVSVHALVLLTLWPLALLFPAAVPFGLGQVAERIEAGLVEWLEDSPWLYWLPVRDVELQPLAPGTELLCVTLGLLLPCLLGYGIIRDAARRALLALLAIGGGVAATALSAALSYGPEHIWAWVSLPTQVGLGLAGLLALALLWVPPRVASALLLLALAIDLSLINQAPTGPYLAQTLATWEQGRFIRFNGLAQWLGWLWPYAALLYVLTRVWSRGQKT